MAYLLRAKKNIEEQDIHEFKVKKEKYLERRKQRKELKETAHDYEPVRPNMPEAFAPALLHRYADQENTSIRYAEYIGSFSVNGTDQNVRTEFIKRQLNHMRYIVRSKPVLLIISVAGVKITDKKGQVEELNHIIGNAFKAAQAAQKSVPLTFNQRISDQLEEQKRLFEEVQNLAEMDKIQAKLELPQTRHRDPLDSRRGQLNNQNIYVQATDVHDVLSLGNPAAIVRSEVTSGHKKLSPIIRRPTSEDYAQISKFTPSIPSTQNDVSWIRTESLPYVEPRVPIEHPGEDNSAYIHEADCIYGESLVVPPPKSFSDYSEIEDSDSALDRRASYHQVFKDYIEYDKRSTPASSPAFSFYSDNYMQQPSHFMGSKRRVENYLDPVTQAHQTNARLNRSTPNRASMYSSASSGVYSVNSIESEGMQTRPLPYIPGERYQNDSPFRTEDNKRHARQPYRSDTENGTMTRISEQDAKILRDNPWFKPTMSRDGVIEALSREDIGSFLVRESTTQSGCFALSVKVPKFDNATGIAHYLIHRTPAGGVKLKGLDKEWSNLSSLVVHHTIMPELLPCTLKMPHRPSRRETPNRNNNSTNTIGQRSKIEANGASIGTFDTSIQFNQNTDDFDKMAARVKDIRIH